MLLSDEGQLMDLQKTNQIVLGALSQFHCIDNSFNHCDNSLTYREHSSKSCEIHRFILFRPIFHFDSNPNSTLLQVIRDEYLNGLGFL